LSPTFALICWAVAVARAGISAACRRRRVGRYADPKDLGPVLKRPVAAVKRDEPALLDTVTQPR
jgi:hypothetical protein